MKFAIVILGVLCFSHAAVVPDEEETRAGNPVTCVVQNIDNALKQAINFPNAINACLGNVVGMPTDVTNMINDLVAKVKNVQTQIEAFQKASGLKKISAAIEVVKSVTEAMQAADQAIQRVNAVVDNPQARKCINDSVNNIRNSFGEVRKC